MYSKSQMFLATLHPCESFGNTEFQTSKACMKKSTWKTQRTGMQITRGSKLVLRCWLLMGWKGLRLRLRLRLSRRCQQVLFRCKGLQRGGQGGLQGVPKKVPRGAQRGAKGWPTAHRRWPDYWAGLRLAAVVAASACREPPTEPGRCPQPSKLTAGASFNISISNQPY